MKKKELGIGQYVTTSTCYFEGRINHIKENMSLTDEAKAAVLEFLTESDEFHKLVCDITGTERKQVKVSQELEKLKEDYSHVCDRYKQEQQKSNDLLHKWREETAKRLDAERERDCAQKHHKFVMDELFSMLKEVNCSSVRSIVEELKAERANGKLLAEENELCRRENDKLKQSYDNVCEEKRKAEKAKSETEKKYNIGLDNLNRWNNNQAKVITDQMNDLLKLRKELKAQKDLAKKYMAKSEKLQSKLDKASKRYGELIKTISDRAIKSI
jgi:regulator of replication initiation timing